MVGVHKTKAFSAAELLAIVNTPSRATESAAFGSPQSGQALFPLIDLPPGETAAGHPWRAAAQLYVMLRYPSPVNVLSVKAQLQNDTRIGYVDIDQPVDYSAQLPIDRRLRPASYFGPPDPDEVTYQRGLLAMKFDQAWGNTVSGADNFLRGTASVGLLDVYPGGNYEINSQFSVDRSYGLINGNNSNSDCQDAGLPCTYSQIAASLIGGTSPHGMMTSSLIAAQTQNAPPNVALGAEGMAGGCWACRILNVSSNKALLSGPSTLGMIEDGAQVINHSGFFRNFGALPNSRPSGTPCAAFSGDNAARYPFCVILDVAKERQIDYVASAGNHLSQIAFPASEPNAIAVGGIDVRGNRWNEKDWGDEDGEGVIDRFDGCPNLPPIAGVPDFECGSNAGPELDFVAAARKIVLAMPAGNITYVDYLCGDDKHPDFDIGMCTGTSFAAPLVTAAIALARTANPLLSTTKMFEALKASASSQAHSNTLGWGSIDAGALMRSVYGRSAGAALNNSLKPLFVVRQQPLDTPAVQRDMLYTSSPQLAVNAILGELYTQFGAGVQGVTPENRGANAKYYIDVPSTWSAVRGVAGYSQYPRTNRVPRASFYVFSNPESPFAGVTLKPLHRLVMLRKSCDDRDHAYTTDTAGLQYYTQTDFCPQSQFILDAYRKESVEGFIFSQCPPGMGCTTFSDPLVPQPVYRRLHSQTGERVLLLGSELDNPAFAQYTLTEGGSGPIGYAFVNVDSDSDGLIDGLERLLGTNYRATDSDCDGVADGAEFPVTGVQAAGQDPAIGTTGCMDLQASVSGQRIDPVTSQFQYSAVIALPSGPRANVTSTLLIDSLYSLAPMGNLSMSSAPVGWSCSNVNRSRMLCSGPPPALGQSSSFVFSIFSEDHDDPMIGAVRVTAGHAGPDAQSGNNVAQWNP